jgi:hypothetical protein
VPFQAHIRVKREGGLSIGSGWNLHERVREVGGDRPDGDQLPPTPRVRFPRDIYIYIYIYKYINTYI